MLLNDPICSATDKIIIYIDLWKLLTFNYMHIAIIKYEFMHVTRNIERFSIKVYRVPGNNSLKYEIHDIFIIF